MYSKISCLLLGTLLVSACTKPDPLAPVERDSFISMSAPANYKDITPAYAKTAAMNVNGSIPSQLMYAFSRVNSVTAENGKCLVERGVIVPDSPFFGTGVQGLTEASLNYNASAFVQSLKMPDARHDELFGADLANSTHQSNVVAAEKYNAWLTTGTLFLNLPEGKDKKKNTNYYVTMVNETIEPGGAPKSGNPRTVVTVQCRLGSDDKAKLDFLTAELTNGLKAIELKSPSY